MLQYAILSYGNPALQTLSRQHFHTFCPFHRNGPHPFNSHLL